MGRGTRIRVLETTCARPKACHEADLPTTRALPHEGFIQLRRSWPAADKPLTTVLQIVRDHQLCFARRVRRLNAVSR